MTHTGWPPEAEQKSLSYWFSLCYTRRTYSWYLLEWNENNFAGLYGFLKPTWPAFFPASQSSVHQIDVTKMKSVLKEDKTGGNDHHTWCSQYQWCRLTSGECSGAECSAKTWHASSYMSLPKHQMRRLYVLAPFCREENWGTGWTKAMQLNRSRHSIHTHA